MNENTNVFSLITRGPYKQPDGEETPTNGPDPDLAIFLETLKAMNDAGRISSMAFVAFDQTDVFFPRGHLLPNVDDPIVAANQALGLAGALKMLEQDLINAAYNLAYDPPDDVVIE